MGWLLGRLVAQTAHSVATQEGRALPVQFHITTLLRRPSSWEKGKLGSPKEGRLYFVLKA